MLTLCGVTSGMASQGRGRRRLTDAGLKQAGFDRRLVAVLCSKHNSTRRPSWQMGIEISEGMPTACEHNASRGVLASAAPVAC